MTRAFPWFRFVVCASIVLAAPRAARAQQDVHAGSNGRGVPPPRTEIFGGYSYLLDPGNAVLAITAGDNAFPIGWSAGVAQPLKPWLAAVAEASGNYKSKTTFDDDVSLAFHGVMGGARVRARIGPLVEFAQVLTGAVHAHGSAFGISVSTTGWSVQPGGGVDYAIGSRLAARLELDYRWIRSTSDGRAHASQFRAVAALVLH